MFNMTTPCDDCPFRREGGIRLHASRVREIAAAFTTQGAGAGFPCHKTVEFADDGEHDDTVANIGDIDICAGGLLFAMKQGRENQIMQIFRRLGVWKPERMRGAELVFDSLTEMLKGQRQR